MPKAKTLQRYARDLMSVLLDLEDVEAAKAALCEEIRKAGHDVNQLERAVKEEMAKARVAEDADDDDYAIAAARALQGK